MRSQEIRSSFLQYFADHGHKIVPSSPLIPHDDPTLLFTNAGMNQFKKVFLGLEKRDYKTAASSQKCIRAGGKHNDLENVGFTARHHTFFEMLGNFSFGDYFKEEAIAYAWEYVTRILRLDPSHLYATVFTEDDEAEKLWRKIAPELGDRVLRFGEKDNYWSMGETGPCGPCSEIHYDRGDKYPGELNGEGDRFMEIWNLVFMQFDRDQSGNLTPLPKPSVDTGAGLERFAMILQKAESNYETDLFSGLIRKVEEISGVEYSEDQRGISHKVIADHIRALSFAIADGGRISKRRRDFVLRRIARRGIYYGKLIGLHEPFIYKIVETLVDIMGKHFPEIRNRQDHIQFVIKSEEKEFGRTIDRGLEILEDVIRRVKLSNSNVISGKNVFLLHGTYGFPSDLTALIARREGLQIDLDGFEIEMQKQREESRLASTFRVISFKSRLPYSESVCHKRKQVTTHLIHKDKKDGQTYLVLEKTPFYAESGGQVGDKGQIFTNRGYFAFSVKDTQNYGGSIIHIGDFRTPEMEHREIRAIPVIAKVYGKRRAEVERNHTATHLLHKALRIVLGNHVHQSGSYVAPDGLRFDFTHFKAMTPDEINRVENIVRGKIKEGLTVTAIPDKSLEEAKKMGAIALFGEKYDDIVRVVKTSDDFSIELCGGTHVDHTKDIGDFFITQETAIAAGMRRIEALTSTRVRKFFDKQSRIISHIDKLLSKSAKDFTMKDATRFRDLLSKTNKRFLIMHNLFEKYIESSNLIKQALRRKQVQEAEIIHIDALNLKPSAIMNNEMIVVYKPKIANKENLLIYFDVFKRKHPRSAIVAVSGSTGSFAISSPKQNFSKDIFNEIVSISGAKGGGKPTIRGAMPVEKIDSVIMGLKKRFG